MKTGKKFAEILTEEGKIFPLIGLMDGFLIEINEAIENDPNIILNYVRIFFTKVLDLKTKNFSFYLSICSARYDFF